MLKATGIVRRVDDLGRIVLPIGLRRSLGIGPHDALEIFVDGDGVVMQKYLPGCLFCGEREHLTPFRGKLVCRDCRAAITG